MDSASGRPINPASVKPAGRGAPVDVSKWLENQRYLLLDKDKCPESKASGVAEAFAKLDPETIAQAAHALLSKVCHDGKARECLIQGLQRFVEQRSAGTATLEPSRVRPAAAPSHAGQDAPSGVAAVGPLAANDQLAQMFRPPPGTLEAQPKLDRALRETLGDEGLRGLSKLSKDYSDFEKQRAAIDRKNPEGSLQWQEARQELDASPLGQRVAAGLSQVPDSARGMLVKVLEHQQYQIGRDPVQRAQQATALMEGVTAMRDMQLAQGLAGVRQHATVFKAVERLSGAGRESVKSGLGQHSLAKVAALKPDSAEWGAIESAHQSAVPQTTRQEMIRDARIVLQGWGPIQAIAPIVGLGEPKQGALTELDAEGLAGLGQEHVYQALQQSSTQHALPVLRTYGDVFAAAQQAWARRGGDFETMAEASLARWANLATDASGWKAIEARLGRSVPGAQRDLMVAAARRFQESDPEAWSEALQEAQAPAWAVQPERQAA